MELLPDARLQHVARMITRGLVSSQPPVVTQIARGTGHADETIWPTRQRAYRFLNNLRLSSRLLFKGPYRVALRAAAEQKSKSLVVTVDPVNFEKPYLCKPALFQLKSRDVNNHQTILVAMLPLCYNREAFTSDRSFISNHAK